MDYRNSKLEKKDYQILRLKIRSIWIILKFM